MIPQFTDTEFKNAKTFDLLRLKCLHCDNIFFKTKKRVKDALNPNKQDKLDFCNTNCHVAYQSRTKVQICCTNCNKKIIKQKYASKRVKNNFCSNSCKAIYMNKTKQTGYNRSKLEKFIESQLLILYPTLQFQFNNRTTINAELDIYIPTLKLAFELNGIFHYEPIYNEEKLKTIQNNDNRKMQACLEKNIELCVINTSNQKYFKEKSSYQFLDIIVSIIDKKIIAES